MGSRFLFRKVFPRGKTERRRRRQQERDRKETSIHGRRLAQCKARTIPQINLFNIKRSSRREGRCYESAQSDNIRLVKEESKHTIYFEEGVQAGHQSFTQAKCVSCPPLCFAGDVKVGSEGPCSQMQHEGPCVKYKRTCNLAVAPEFKMGH